MLFGIKLEEEQVYQQKYCRGAGYFKPRNKPGGLILKAYTAAARTHLYRHESCVYLFDFGRLAVYGGTPALIIRYREENEIFFIPCYVRRETCVVAFKAVCRSLAQLRAVVFHGAVGLRQGSAGLVAAERRHFKIFYIIENILILFYLLIG